MHPGIAKGLRMITWIVVILISLCAFLLLMENRMVYHPSPWPEGYWEPEDVGLQVEDAEFKSSDGTRLHGWWVRHPNPIASLIWFHGNAGNLSHRLYDIKILHQLGLSVFIFDYRGYGKSEGRPDEDGLMQDSLAAYDYLVTDREQDPSRLILYGRSIGGVFALAVASQRPAAGVIVESSLTSARDMAGVLYPFLPIRWLIRSRLDSLSRVPTLTVPKLFAHGDRDTIIPYRLGRKLYEAAAEPKEFHTIDGADHNDTFEAGGPSYLNTLMAFIRKHAVSATRRKTGT